MDGSQVIQKAANSQSLLLSACDCIFDEGQSELIVGKSMLPPIKSAMTVSKMELNAITLVVRLANSIRQPLESVV